MADISVCMIVKNEEKNLAKCLNSLGDIPDEIIIVDTGSTDATKQIAQKYTDKVYDFAWVDDFAAARNFSLSKAKCEYIYVADADEEIDEDNLKLFRQLKQALLPEVEVVEMAYVNPSPLSEESTTENFGVEYRPKLFRRLREFQFADPIHETLRTDPVVYRSNVMINHLPHGNHAARDLAQLARLVKSGQVFSSRLEMMYARELMFAGDVSDFLSAKPYFEAVYDDPSNAPERLRRAACVLVRCAMLQRDAELLLQVAAPELVGTPPSEICCALADYHLAMGSHRQAAEWYTAALSGAEPELVAASVGSLPLKGLAACHEAIGDAETAEKYLEQARLWGEEHLRMSGV